MDRRLVTATARQGTLPPSHAASAEKAEGRLLRVLLGVYGFCKGIKLLLEHTEAAVELPTRSGQFCILMRPRGRRGNRRGAVVHVG